MKLSPQQVRLALGDERALPDLVWCISLWWRWAALVAAGAKTIETRGRPWPYGPSWLVIHAAKRETGEVRGAVDPLPEVPPVTPGALCALVWVAESRPLVPADLPRALCYAPNRFAWVLGEARRMKPVPMRGPQNLVRVRREVVEAALI